MSTSVALAGSPCFPVLSFLHVPGKMSKPLWLMMGTAFRVAVPSIPGTDPGTPESASKRSRPLFLTAKHTFAPWDYTKDANDLKIPMEYRKARFVIGKIYAADPESGSALASQKEELSILSVHPSLDVALLSLRHWPPTSPTSEVFSSSKALTLCANDYTPPKGAGAVVEGFRGTGRLGELDTFDPTLLQRLSPADRESLLKELQDVEGRQVWTKTAMEILDPKGMCRSTEGADHGCFHGMSGGPVITESTTGDDQLGSRHCAGVLYGKHPDFPLNIGYTPSYAFAEWFEGSVRRAIGTS